MKLYVCWGATLPRVNSYATSDKRQKHWRRFLSSSKVSRSVRRRWFEWRLSRVPLEGDHEMVHLGSDWGGWYVPDRLIEADWVCYSVGAGSDVSFDLELISRYGAAVRSFDPLAEFGRQALEAAKGDPRFTFYETAIAPKDGRLKMYRDVRPDSGTLSAANLLGGKESIVVPARSLGSLMHELGDERVDLLKLDVEGSEYELVPTIDFDALGVRVFMFELHYTRSAREARALLDGLRSQGFDLVHRKDPTSFTLVRRGEAAVGPR